MGRSWPRPLRSLANRNVRLFLTGHSISVIGTWMQRVAQDWLVLEITDDAVAVGVAAALQFLPTLVFGLWGGVLVDRWDKRRIIIGTQTLSMVLAATLAAVVLADVASLLIVDALALALGFVTVLDNPARQAFVAEVAGPDDNINAQGLASTVHNVGRLVGPAIAGAVIGAFGSGPAFALNAVSFVPVIWGLVLIDAAPARPRSAVAARRQVREGLRYVFGHPELRACMILVSVVALFGQNFRAVLPILARDTFHGGAEVYGWLTSALGVGAVAGALAVASTSRVTSWRLVLAASAFGVVNAAVALAPWLWVAMLAMVGVGVANLAFNTLARTLLQLRTDPAMHGRVMALHSFVFLGTTPLGMPLLGWICDVAGARAGMAVASGTALVAVALLQSRLRRLRGQDRELSPATRGAP